MSEPIHKAFVEFGQTTFALLERGVYALESIAASLKTAPPPTAGRPASSGGSGAVFPNFGKTKGEPIAGATPANLRFYAHAAIRSLGDAAKARYHAKERENLAAYKAELVRQGQAVDDLADPAAAPAGEPDMRDDEPPAGGGGAPADDDIPF